MVTSQVMKGEWRESLQFLSAEQLFLGQIDLGCFSQAGLGEELSGPLQVLGQELMAGQPALYPQSRICSPLSSHP